MSRPSPDTLHTTMALVIDTVRPQIFDVCMCPGKVRRQG